MKTLKVMRVFLSKLWVITPSRGAYGGHALEYKAEIAARGEFGENG